MRNIISLTKAVDDFLFALGDLIEVRNILTGKDEERVVINNKREYEKIYSECLMKMIKALGDIFPDKKCLSITITDDSDKEFFGVITSYTEKELERLSNFIFRSNKSTECYKRDTNSVVDLRDYMIEIDGRLLDLDINVSCIGALIIREIEVITSKQAIIDLVGVYDWVCDKYGTECCYNKSKIIELNNFVIAHTLYTMNSVFFKAPGELCLATELLRSAELIEQFDTGYETINRMGDTITKQNCPKTLTINWLIANMSEYGGKELNMTQRRMMALTLRDAYENTSSVIWKKLINSNIKIFNKHPQEYINTGEYTPVTEGKKYRGLIDTMKYNGMKSLEDDLFEYSMRAKNIDDENSAILLMRQINNRMGIIYDYLESEDLSDTEKKRWNNLYDKYDSLREMMIKKPIYSRKMYGLFVDYNALMNMNNPENAMTMNTIY